MKPMLLRRGTPFIAALLVGLACSSSSDDDEQAREGATETNFAPVPCTSDEECPTTRCVLRDDDGGEGSGYCEAK